MICIFLFFIITLLLPIIIIIITLYYMLPTGQLAQFSRSLADDFNIFSHAIIYYDMIIDI